MSGLLNAVTKPFTSILGIDSAKAQEKAARQQKEQYEKDLLIAQNNTAIANQNAASATADVNVGGLANDADTALAANKKNKTRKSISQSLGI